MYYHEKSMACSKEYKELYFFKTLVFTDNKYIAQAIKM